MQNRKYDARGLVFGGLMAALVVVCALIPFLSFFMPIPLVMAYTRYGGRIAALAGVVAVLFSALLVGPLQAFLLLVPAGILPGLVFGYGFRHKLKPLVIMLIAVSVFFIGFGVDYFVTRTALLGGQDPIIATLESPEMKQAMDRVFALMEGQLLSASPRSEAERQALDQALSQLQEMREHMPDIARVVMPSAIFLAGALTSWFNYVLCRLILPRFGVAVPAPTPFGEFRLPLWLTWAMVLVLFATQYIGGSLVDPPWQVRVLINLAGPLIYICTFVGFAVAYGWLRRRGIPKPVAIFLVVAVLFFLGQLGFYFYLLLAMWDTIFDFRGLGHGLFSQLKGAR